MSDNEELLVKISADIEELKAGLLQGSEAVKQTAGNVRESSDQMSASFNKVKEGIEGVRNVLRLMVAGELAETVKRSLDYAESLQTMSKLLDINTDKVQEWHYIAVSAGISTEAMDMSMRRLSQSLGKAAESGSETSAVFQKLKLDPHSFKDTDDAMTQVIGRLGEIDDAGIRSSLSMQIFGRYVGPQMAALAADGADGLDKLRRAAHDTGSIMDEELVKSAAEAAKQVNQLGLVIKTEFNSALVTLGPLLIESMSLVDKWAYAVHAAAVVVTDFFSRVHEDTPLSDQIAVLKARKAELEKMIADPNLSWGTRFFGDLPDKLADVNAQLAQTQAAQAALLGASPTSKFTPGSENFVGPVQAPFELGQSTAEKDAARKLADEQNKILRESDQIHRQMIAEQIQVDDEAAKQFVAMQKDSVSSAKEVFDAYIKHRVGSAAEATQAVYEETAAELTINDKQYQEELRGLAKFHNESGESEDAYRAKQLAAEQAHAAREVKIVQDASDQIKQIKKIELDQELSFASNMLTALSELHAAHGRKSFEIAKVASIGVATIKTYQATISAIADTDGPWYVKLAAGVAAAAAGAAQIANIAGTSYGGGGGGAALGAANSAAGIGTSPTGPARTTIVNLQGDAATPTTFGNIRNLIDQINEGLADGSKIIVTGGAF